MTARELRRQHQVDKHRLKRRARAVHVSYQRMPQAITEEQDQEEQINPGFVLPSVGTSIAAFLQSRRFNFTR